MKLHDAADQLARMLRDYRWYHRVTSVQEKDPLNVWHSWIRVYGTGARPKTLPARHKDYLIEWCRISPQFPCPFGSVRETDKEET